MPNITIRNVPEPVRNELAARAAMQGQSMQEYLLSELTKLSQAPSVSSWLNAVRERKAEYGRHMSAKSILASRDADRK